MSVNTEPLGGSVTDPGGISKVSPPLLGHIPTLVRHSRRSVRGNLNRPSTKKQSRAASAPLSMFGDRNRWRPFVRNSRSSSPSPGQHLPAPLLATGSPAAPTRARSGDSSYQANDRPPKHD